MVQPVMLVETGHTYEAAAIQRWLASSDVCPVSNQKLSSQQTAPNHALKRLIVDWAATHNVDLPQPPIYSSHNADHSRSVGSAAATTAAATAAASMHNSSQSSAQRALGASIAIHVNGFPGPKGSRSGGVVPCHCTRTRWAVAGSALLLSVALAIGLGVGVPMVIRTSKGETSFT
jgi:hypothetical protein